MRPILLVFLFVVGAIGVGAQAPHPFAGEWTANVAKSKLSPAYTFTRATLSVAVSPDAKTITMTSDVTLTSGVQQRASETFPTDGTEVPASLTPGVTLVAKWLDPHVLASLAKKGGVVFELATYEVSSDRNTLTVRGSGSVEHTLVLERTK